MSGRDARGGIEGARERAGIHRGKWRFGERFTQTFRLVPASLVQWDIGTAERETTAVVFGLTMANEENARSQASVSPDRR